MSAEGWDPLEAAGAPPPQASWSAGVERLRNSSVRDHRALVAAFEAAGEIVDAQGLPRSPTAYFACLMQSLDAQGRAGGDAEAAAAAATLLAAVLPATPRAVLRSKCEMALGVLARVEVAHDGAQAVQKAVLGCRQHLFSAAVGADGGWAATGASFGAMLRRCVDARPKVRKRALVAVQGGLRAAQGTPAHQHASEAVARLVGEVLPAAARTDDAAAAVAAAAPDGGVSEAERRAREALQLVSSLRSLVPLLDARAASAVANALAALLTASRDRQPMLHKLVVDAAAMLFADLSSDMGVAPAEGLLGAVLSSPINARKDPDGAAALCRLTATAMRRIGSLDGSAAARLLPRALHAVLPMLAELDHEALAFAATEATADMLRHVSPAACAADPPPQAGAPGAAGPPRTVGERCAVALENMLGVRHKDAWPLVLTALAAFAEAVGADHPQLLVSVLAAAAELHSDSADPLAKANDLDLFDAQLGAALGAALRAMGAAPFLATLPLQMELDLDSPDSRAWLLPLVIEHAKKATGSIGYWVRTLLPAARQLEARADAFHAAGAGHGVEAQAAYAAVAQLWEVLASMCCSPDDIATSFQLVAKDLGAALQTDSAERRSTAARALRRLAFGVSERRKAAREEGDGQVVAREDAAAAAIARFSRNFLPILFNLALAAKPEEREELLATVEAIALVTPADALDGFFKQVLRKLLEATAEASDGNKSAEENSAAATRQGIFVELAMSLSEGLPAEATAMLLRGSRPLLSAPAASVQKKAYKLLARLAERRPEVVAGALDETVAALADGLGACATAARRNRLRCLRHVIALFALKRREAIEAVEAGQGGGEGSDGEDGGDGAGGATDPLRAVAPFVGEIVLGVKESNQRTRLAAYELLVELARHMEEAGGDELLRRFFMMVVGALAGSTQHMVAAAVAALARLLFDFPEALLEAAPELMSTVLLLLRSKSREIVKSVLGFCKVLISRLSPTEMTLLLPEMAEGLFAWCDDSKNQFKMKVRVLVERLVRKCGYEAVQAAIPEHHARLLVHIRKEKAKEERKRQARSEMRAGDDAKSGRTTRTAMTAMTARTLARDWAEDDVFGDGGSDEGMGGASDEDMDGGRGGGGGGYARSMMARSRALSSVAAGARRKVVLPDSDFDLLGGGATRAALAGAAALKERRLARRRAQGEDDFGVDKKSGRLDFSEVGGKGRAAKRGRDVDYDDDDDEMEGDEEGDEGDDDDDTRSKKRARGGKARSVSGMSMGGRSARTVGGRSARTAGGRSAGGRSAKSNRAGTGREYASARAGGDKQLAAEKHEPYAYWTLDAALLNKKRAGKKAQAMRQMASTGRLGANKEQRNKASLGKGTRAQRKAKAKHRAMERAGER